MLGYYYLDNIMRNPIQAVQMIIPSINPIKAYLKSADLIFLIFENAIIPEIIAISPIGNASIVSGQINTNTKPMIPVINVNFAIGLSLLFLVKMIDKPCSFLGLTIRYFDAC